MEFYNPLFYDKEVTLNEETGERTFHFKPKILENGVHKYWDCRDRGDWSEIPRIYDDDCEPFY